MSDTDAAKPNHAPWKWIVGAAILAVLIGGWFLLPVKEWANAFQGWISGLGVWGGVLFAAIYAIATVLLVPVSVLTVVAGLAFGLGWGFALVVVSATVGATLAFLVSRYLVHGHVRSMVDKRPKFKAVNDAVSEEGWKIVGLLRLSPVVPFNLQNYFYGITDVKLAHYVPATFVGILPGTLLYVYLGAAGKAAVGGGGGGGALQWAFFAAGLVATIVVAVLVTRKARKKLREKGVGEDGSRREGADGHGADGHGADPQRAHGSGAAGAAEGEARGALRDTGAHRDTTGAGGASGRDGSRAAAHRDAAGASSPVALEVDLCVIGAGSAGLTAAATAAPLGVKVVLIERGEMGGECLNTGCVPSKALLAAAKAAHTIRGSARFGVEAGEPRVDFAAVHRHVHEVIASIAPHDSVERFEGLGVEVIRAEARFVGPRELVAGGRRIRARRIIIATGSAPRVPKIDGIERVAYFTNETIFDNATLPEHLLIVGGGPLGIELAQAHRRLGARVTVIQNAEAMPRDDRELARRLLQVLATEGVTVREHTRVAAARSDGTGGVVLSLEHGGTLSELAGSHLLLATGRKASTGSLDLDRAGVRHDAHGIVVDAHLQTSVRGVYAIGDVVAKAPRFTHVAGYHAGIATINALTWPLRKARYDALPWVTYTDPELAHVGASEADARRAHGDDVQILTFEMRSNDRAQAERDTRGAVRVIARSNGRVLGVSILDAHAGELVHVWVLAIQSKLKLSAIAQLFAPYPTLGEANKGAAIEFYKPKFTSVWVKRAVRLFALLP